MFLTVNLTVKIWLIYILAGYFFRLIVLNVNCFDSKQKFVDSLRAAYGEGTSLLGPHVTASVVNSYACHLKEDFSQQENKRVFYEPGYMGYQGNKYWIVSNDVSSLNWFTYYTCHQQVFYFKQNVQTLSKEKMSRLWQYYPCISQWVWLPDCSKIQYSPEIFN